MFIYVIRNTYNGKVLIGQTVQDPPRKRWNSHRNSLRENYHRNPHLQNAWNKYGNGVFEFEVIDDTADDVKRLNELEISYIEKYNSLNPMFGYNKREGGQGGGKFSESIKAKMRGRKVSAVGRKRMSEAKSGKNHPHYGKIFSDETKWKMSEASKGKSKSKEHAQKCKLAARKLSLEMAQNIRNLYKNEKLSHKMLAKEYGVHRSTIGRLVRGETYVS